LHLCLSAFSSSLHVALPIFGVAAGDFQRFLDDEKCRVRTGRVETGIMLIASVDAGDEFLVVRCIEARGIPAGAESIDRLIAHQLDRKSTRLNSSHEWISYAV